MRKASIIKNTEKSTIKCTLDLDGGQVEVYTGIGFFDHMLITFAKYCGVGMVMQVTGDLEIDAHHTIDDTATVLGEAFYKALKDKKGIKRFASQYVAMDDALAFSCVDISNKPYLVFDANFPQEKAGDFDACLTEEFMRLFAFNASLTLHIKSVYGNNTHHIIESMFKALALSIKEGIAVTK